MTFADSTHYEHICIFIRDEFDNLTYGTNEYCKCSEEIIFAFLSCIKKFLDTTPQAAVISNDDMLKIGNDIIHVLNSLKEIYPSQVNSILKKISFIDYISDPEMLGIQKQNYRDFLYVILNVATAKIEHISNDTTISKREFLAFMLNINQMISKTSNAKELIYELDKIHSNYSDLNHKLVIESYPIILKSINALSVEKKINLLAKWLIDINDKMTEPTLKISYILEELNQNINQFIKANLTEKTEKIAKDPEKFLSTFRHEFLAKYYNELGLHDRDLNVAFMIIAECFDYNYYEYHNMINTVISSEIIQKNLLNQSLDIREIADIMNNGLTGDLTISRELTVLYKLSKNNTRYLTPNRLGAMTVFFTNKIRYSMIDFILNNFNQVNFDFKDRNGCTALHKACYNGDYRLIKIFVDKGFNLSSKDIYDNTPIHEFIKRNPDEAEIIKLLINKDVVNITNSNGNTPFELAVIRKHKQHAMILLDNIKYATILRNKKYYIEICNENNLPCVVDKIERILSPPPPPSTLFISQHRNTIFNENYFAALSESSDDESQYSLSSDTTLSNS